MTIKNIELDPAQQTINHIITQMVKWMFFLAFPLVGLSWLRIFKTGFLPVMGIHLFIFTLLLLSFISKKTIPTTFKAWVIIFIFFLIGTGAVLNNQNHIQFAAPYYLIAIFLSLFFFNLATSLKVLVFTVIVKIIFSWSRLITGDLTILLFLVGNLGLTSLTIYIVNKLKTSLFEQIQNANAANEAKSNFLAVMTHELRTPLNGILGASQLIDKENLKDDQKEYLEIVHQSGENLLELINSILDLSKIEANKINIEEHEVNINTLLNNLYQVHSLQAKHNGNQLKLEKNGEIPQVVLADALRLKQILNNFLSNAIKFTKNGSVTLKCNVIDKTEQKVKLFFAVEDTGIGITNESLKELFQEFHQADNTITRKFGGTGLGLSISKKLTQMMGSEIKVESEYGKGSIFSFEIEFDILESNTLTNEINKISDASKNLKLLLVEDNKINTKVAKGLLSKLGFKNIDTAENGVEAIEACCKNQYDVIFMDLQMPRMDGISATIEIRKLENYKDTLIIALSANAFEDDKIKCFQNGMDHFLSKPISRDSLIAYFSKL
ncbi:MAG: response regulator [Oligoflexia bacterium]|nr:response regulator [Oligoflexia bacterium]